METRPLPRHTLLADDLTEAFQFFRHVLVRGNDVVKGIGNFASQTHPGTRQAHAEIAIPHALQTRQNSGEVNLIVRSSSISRSCCRFWEGSQSFLFVDQGRLLAQRTVSLVSPEDNERSTGLTSALVAESNPEGTRLPLQIQFCLRLARKGGAELSDHSAQWPEVYGYWTMNDLQEP